MLTCDSHLTVMLASAGAQFGNYRRFLCLYMSKTRKAGNTAQLNVCPMRVQLSGLGLACLFISFFHSLSPTVCLVVPGASLTTGPLSPMHSPPVPSFSLSVCSQSTCMQVCVCVCTCMYESVYVCLCACMCVSVCKSMYVCMHMSAYVHAYV